MEQDYNKKTIKILINAMMFKSILFDIEIILGLIQNVKFILPDVALELLLLDTALYICLFSQLQCAAVYYR